MKKLHSLDEIDSFTEQQLISLVYVSQPDCSVCHALLPQVEELLHEYPRIKSCHIDISEVREISGKYSVFTVPVVMIFSKGEELFRQARFVRIKELNQQLAIYNHLIQE